MHRGAAAGAANVASALLLPASCRCAYPCQTVTAHARTNTTELAASETAYGALVQRVELALTSGSYWWSLAHPGALFWYLCQTSVALCSLVARTLLQQECTRDKPWELIFYLDGITPANNLKPDQRLRTNCIYWSISNFGAEALSNTDLWFVLGYFQEEYLEDLPSSIAGLCKAIFSVLLGFIRKADGLGRAVVGGVGQRGRSVGR